MKHFIITCALLLCSSCTTHKVISSLSVTAELENKNVFLVHIEAIDKDGISSVSINIDALNYQVLFKEIHEIHWNFQQTFTLNSLTEIKPTVRVTLIDTKGNQKHNY